jgi:hypothetical protein
LSLFFSELRSSWIGHLLTQFLILVGLQPGGCHECTISGLVDPM